MAVHRAPMRSRDDAVDPELALERAFALGVVGMGGRLAVPPASLAEALAELSESDERAARRLERFAALPVGDQVWTRDADGRYRSGVLTGEWRYDVDPRAHEADLVHVRATRWDPESLDEAGVPPAVVATFARGGRNLQRIRALD
ncbi:GAF domain-containing protein [Nocardioides nanhaiensis]|uniref:GAF domain-containing protein n=1 Tax=Nocardioides nanhaiensis TaxID=1476871 RepID=A0ABP8WL91_9ACTN